MNQAQRRSLRNRVWKRDKGICWICFRPIAQKSDMTLDHVVPKSRGGTNRLDNVRAAHKLCNNQRGAPGGGLHFMKAAGGVRIPLVETDARIGLTKRSSI